MKQLSIFDEPNILYVIEEKINNRWIFFGTKFEEEEAKKFIKYCESKGIEKYRMVKYIRKEAKRK